MKKIIFSLLLTCTTLTLTAQTPKFELTRSGTFVDSGKNENSFLVFEFEGKSQKELYDMAIYGISKIYGSPKEVISKVDDSLLSIRGFQPECIVGRIMGMKFWYNIRYTMTLQFKDGKIRVNSPFLIKITHPNPSADKPEIYFPRSIYNKKGNVKNEETKKSIESFFNSLIYHIIYTSDNTISNDW